MDVEKVKSGYKTETKIQPAAFACGESRRECAKNSLIEQVMPHQLLQQVVPVDLADKTAGVVEIGDIRRVLREKIADDLVDGIVALFIQRAINRREDFLHFLRRIVRDHKLDCIIVHTVYLLF